MNKFLKLILVALGVGVDVVTVTSGTVGNAGNVAASLITYLSAKLLEVAELYTVLDQFGDKVPLPPGSSKTIRFVRQEKLPVSTSPTQLTEGISPDARGITLNQFEATAEQYGDLVRLSDLAELTAKHDVVQRTMYMLGLQVAEIYDQLIFNVLDAATNTYRPNSRVSDATLLGPDRLSYVDLVNLLALHQDQGARPISGTDYIVVLAPQVHGAMLLDPDFKAVHQFPPSNENIFKGEVDRIAGMKIVVSNAPAFAPLTSAVSGVSSKVFSGFVIARYAYQITDLQGVRTYAVPPGGHTDPLEQSRLMGWKFAFKSLITNQNWIRRIRCSGLNSVTNP